jgi:F0F1-type ATP synthase assembly protein I
MGLSVAIGYGVGWWLDEKFGTQPTFAIAMLLFGIAAAFFALYRTAKSVTDNRKSDDGQDGQH